MSGFLEELVLVGLEQRDLGENDRGENWGENTMTISEPRLFLSAALWKANQKTTTLSASESPSVRVMDSSLLQGGTGDFP